MRALIIGLAKTGTTALMSLVRQGMDPCNLVMEPQSVLTFGPRSLEDRDDEVIKIVYEHWREKWRHLDALVHAEFEFPIDRVVFTTRDVRDQMVSKLLYHAKIARAAGALRAPSGEEQLTQWVRVLEEKERRPSSISFTEMCQRFQDIIGIDIWSAVTNIEAVARYEGYIRTQVERDHYVIAYEKMVQDETGGLADYLGFSLPTRLEAVDLGGFGYTKRSARAGNWRSWFTEQDVNTLRPIVGEWLNDDIYDDWTLTPDINLSPDECSRYVRRIAS